MPSRAELTLPSPATLTQRVAAKLPGVASVQWVAELESTNTRLLSMAREEATQASWPRLLGAHHQTQGKGRLGRTWHDTPGQALMFSAGFALQNKSTPANLQGIGPAIGMTSAIVLRRFLVEPARLRVKWPNDLMLDDGKCAGILIELASKADTLFVVMGIGINLSGHNQLQSALAREVADLGPHFLPNTAADQLVAALATAWQQTLEQINQSGFVGFQAGYAGVDYLANQTVNIIDQDQTIATGTALGLALDGGLQVKTCDGLQTFLAGDVSVRLKHPDT